MHRLCRHLIALGWIAVSPVFAPPAPAAAPSAQLVRAAAPDWPQWRGPRRDGISDETGLLAAWPPEGPKLLWKAGGLGNGYSAPIVVAGTIYITGDEEADLVVHALSLDGSPRWRSKNGASWRGSFPGSRSSCAFDDGKLYHMNAHGRVACLDAQTGRELWAVPALEKFGGKNITWGLSESVIVHGDRVFVTPGGTKGLMVALDKRSGETAWTSAPLAGEQARYSSPILLADAGRQLLVNCGSQHVFALDAADGRLVWHLAHADPRPAVTSTPVFSPAGIAVVNSSRESWALFGVRAGDSPAKIWSKDLSISHGGMVYVDGRFVGSSQRGEVRGWVAVDASSGAAVQIADMARGCLIYADKRFYCLTERGTMTLQELTAKGFRAAGSFELAKEKDVWTHPVILGGRLYLRCHGELFCYDIRQP